MSDHFREMRTSRQGAEDDEVTTANIEHRFEAVFSCCTEVNPIVRVRSSPFSQVLESAFKEFSRDLSKGRTGL